MAEWWEWTGEPGPWQANEAPDMWAGASPTFDESGGGWGGYDQPIGPGLGWDASSYPTGGGGIIDPLTGNPIQSASGGGGFWNSILGGLGSVGSFLGNNASWLGPLASGAGSLAGGAIGSNAANDAARLQAAALNRGIDLSTSQWLQQLERTAPWVQAGQQSLGTLQGLAGREAPALPGASPAIRSADYNASLPDLMPGWRPQAYQGPQGPDAGAYRWQPQQGPQAQDFRYTPGAIPQAANYRYTPGAVPTLSGQELLANDPGVQFRLDEGRKALEASALAKGMGMSGATMSALQRQGQDLASQEYGNAWNRASQQAQLREQWGQAASQMGWQQAEAESRLREQVNQIASQQGWNQATAEAVFREQQAQLASQQGWNQALQGQQNQYTQGLESAKWNQGQQQTFTDEIYKRMLAQNQLLYGRDVAQNATDYDRQQALYRQQLTQHLLPWEQNSTLAQLGAQVTGQLGTQGIVSSSGISNLLGQLGSSQALGTLGSAGQTNQAIAGGVGSLQNILRGLNA